LVHTEDGAASIGAFLTSPLDPFVDPVVQVRIFRQNSDILVVKIYHLVMDGGAANEYLYLLADIYNRLKVVPDFKPAVNLTGSRSLRQVSRRFSLLRKAKILRRSLRDLKCGGIYLLERIRFLAGGRKSSGRAWGLPLTQRSKENRTFIVRKIPAHLVKRLKDYAQSHGATLNDAMLAAYFRAIHGLFAPEPEDSMRVRIISDLRRYLPGNRGEALCNLCAYVSINLGHYLGSSFMETLHCVRDRTISLKKDFMGLGIFPISIAAKFIPFYLVNKLGRFEVDCIDRGYIRPVPKFSNIGEMISNKLIFDKTPVSDAYQLGPVGYGPAFTVGIVGFEGSLTLSVGICDASWNGPVFNRLFDVMEREIARALM
ncbi:MAG: hypothetical protein AAGU11_07235, partial [Syntrophobacteraceae bacterium]